jgi:hypothetical protein
MDYVVTQDEKPIFSFVQSFMDLEMIEDSMIWRWLKTLDKDLNILLDKRFDLNNFSYEEDKSRDGNELKRGN